MSPLRFAQGQALSPCASLRGNSAKGLSRAAARSFAALRMTGLDLAGAEELSRAFEPCLLGYHPTRAYVAIAVGAILLIIGIAGMVVSRPKGPA